MFAPVRSGDSGKPGLFYELKRRNVFRVAALFYSLIESANHAGVEPRAYLREAALRRGQNPGTFTLARDLRSSES